MAPRYKDLTSRKAVLSAIAECDRLGLDDFRARYGFGAADQYVLRVGDRTYDSKAIVAVAYGFQFPDLGPLRSQDLSGGKSHAAGHLSRLGFSVDGLGPRAGDWTFAEVEAIVAVYFELYRSIGVPGLRRKDRIAMALARVPTRGQSSIERKISNICAILQMRDLPYLAGFGALGNKQLLLTALITDWLIDHPETFDRVPEAAGSAAEGAVEVQPPGVAQLDRVARERRGSHVDFAGQDARNRTLGLLGEAWALEVLKEELRTAGRADLADGVEWVSQTQGDGLGFDIASFDPDGSPLSVEVKTTNGGVGAPFIVTANEIAASRAPARYLLMRVFGYAGGPKFYRLRGSLEDTCRLQPTTFRAVPLTK